MRAWPTFLAALLLLPSVPGAAAATLRDLEEPTTLTDDVLDVTVTPEEAGQAAIVLFLNPPGDPFGLTLYRPNGTTAFDRTGSRGVQPLAPLDAGLHKLHVRGQGIFQVTNRSLDTLGGRPVVLDANETLRGTDAWVVVPSRSWALHVEGNVTAELRELGGATREHAAPISIALTKDVAYVLSLRGADGMPYRVRLEAIGTVEPIPINPATNGGGEAPPRADDDVPGPGVPLLLGILALAGLSLRRPRPEK